MMADRYVRVRSEAGPTVFEIRDTKDGVTLGVSLAAEVMSRLWEKLVIAEMERDSALGRNVLDANEAAAGEPACRLLLDCCQEMELLLRRLVKGELLDEEEAEQATVNARDAIDKFEGCE